MILLFGIVRIVLAGAQGAPVPQLSPPGRNPPAAPILRIEVGAHTAPVTGLAVDPAGKFLVTTSDDKSARVWELPSLKLLRVLRPPLGLTPDEGKLNAVALSPDGTTAAVGGWTGLEWGGANCVYLFDVASGKMVSRLGNLSNAITALAFNPLGTRLAVGLGDGGLSILGMPDGADTFDDAAYADGVSSVDYDPAGRLVACSEDGSVRLYGPDGGLVEKLTRPKGSEPGGVAFSPDGTKIALGELDKASVVILSGTTLEVQTAVKTEGLKASVEQVAWSKDGASLIAAASATDKDGRFLARTWSVGGRGASTDVAVAGNTVLGLAALPGGGFAFAAGDGFGTVAADGTVKRVNLPIADFSGLGAGFRLSSNGDRVWFAFRSNDQEPAAFSVSTRALAPNPASEARSPAYPPKQAAANLKVTDWYSHRLPKLNGRVLPLDTFEMSESLAILPDGSGFVLGSEWYVRRFDPKAGVKWKVATHGSALSVNMSGDGRLVVVAFGDGTIRWYRADNGKELLALYVHPDKKRWVLWTPSGYYDCSPGGEELFGWNVNGGADTAAAFLPAAQLRSRNHHPEIISRVLTTLSEPAAPKSGAH